MLFIEVFFRYFPFSCIEPLFVCGGISYCFWVDFPLIRAYHIIYSNTHTLRMESIDSIFGSPIFPRTVCFFDYECVQSRIYILFTSCRLNVFTVGRMELIPLLGKGATKFWIVTVDPTFMYTKYYASQSNSRGKFIRIAIRFEKWHHFPLLISLCKLCVSFFFPIPSSLFVSHLHSVWPSFMVTRQCLYLFSELVDRIAFNFCARRNFHIIKAFDKSLHNNMPRIEFNAIMKK